MANVAYADSTETSEEISYDAEVNNFEELEEALNDGASAIKLLNTETYYIEENFIIPAGVTLVGEDGVIFDTDDNLTSGQAGIYIYYNNVTIKNVTFQNGSGSSKPVIKIQATDITLENCEIYNYVMQSAVVVTSNASAVFKNCIIENTVSGGTYILNGYGVIQVNSGSELTIEGGSITSGNKYQPHVIFEYPSSSTSSSTVDYSIASTLKLDEDVTFSGVYKTYAAIYSAAPVEDNRGDKVIIITDDEEITLNEQTETNISSDGTIIGENTDGTDWYCFNANAWDGILTNCDGYVYTNIDSSENIRYVSYSLIF